MTDRDLPKNSKLRYAEYYGMTDILDGLYRDSQTGRVFCNLMGLISSEENIMMAYRSLKKNRGSYTPSYEQFFINLLKLFHTIGSLKLCVIQLLEKALNITIIGYQNSWLRKGNAM